MQHARHWILAADRGGQLSRDISGREHPNESNGTHNHRDRCAIKREFVPGVGIKTLHDGRHAMDLEGIVCKRKDSPYKVTEKPSRYWIKVKNSLTANWKGARNCSNVPRAGVPGPLVRHFRLFKAEACYGLCVRNSRIACRFLAPTL
jgi:hypothetical protein